MIAIKKTPVYITRELCDEAGLEFSDDIVCYAAVNGRQICGTCFFRIKDKIVTVISANAPSGEILDGVVRAAIAGGQDMGAHYYDFDVDDTLAKRLVVLGFRKAPGTSKPLIDKLFSSCGGCNKNKGE